MKNPLTQITLNFNKVMKLAFTLAKWPKYTALSAPANNISTRYRESKADIILLAEQAYGQLQNSLDAIARLISNKQTVTLLIPAHEQQKIQQLMPQIQKIMPSLVLRVYTDLKKELLNTLSRSTPHVVLSVADTVVTRAIDLNQCIRELEKTYAHAFHLQLSYPGARLDKLHAPIAQNIIAWQYDYTQAVWNAAHVVQATLYRSGDISKRITHLSFANLQEFKQVLSQQKLPPRTVELSFK